MKGDDREARPERKSSLLSADDLDDDAFERILVIGPPKVGKTVMVIGTSPGPVHVILTDQKSALKPAKRRGYSFTWKQAFGHDAVIAAIHEAKTEAKRGNIGTLLFDDLTTYSSKVLEECERQEKHGKAAYGVFNRRMIHLVHQLFLVKAHVVAVSHYMELGGDSDDGTPKTGHGIAPLIPGQSRAKIPAMFPNVVFMDYYEKKRCLYTGPRGAWGPGCRSLHGNKIINADVESGKKYIGIRGLLRAFERDAKGE